MTCDALIPFTPSRYRCVYGWHNQIEGAFRFKFFRDRHLIKYDDVASYSCVILEWNAQEYNHCIFHAKYTIILQ